MSRQQIQQWFKNKEAINDPVNLNRNRRINDRGKSLKRAKYHDIELQLNNFKRLFYRRLIKVCLVYLELVK